MSFRLNHSNFNQMRLASIRFAGRLFLLIVSGFVFFIGCSSPDSAPAELQANVRIASWNIERLGHGRNKDFLALAEIAGRFDFLAVQEAMNREGIANFNSALQEHTGESWSKIHSHLLGDGRYREKYLFIWRDSAIEYVDGAAVYLKDRESFVREPFSARFRCKDTSTVFVAGTIHVRYGNSIRDRTGEIRALTDYWRFLEDTYDGEILLMGDFNLPPGHNAWSGLRRLARPVITEGASTVSSIDGRYANLYDNIWLSRNSRLNIVSAGVLKFPEILGIDHEQARRHVSDHAPVYIQTGSQSVDLSRAQNFRLQISASEQPVVEVIEDGIRGNRNSKVYHRPDCPSYNQIAPRNRVYFVTTAEAENAGYRLAGNCP